ncbi:MAG: histidinol-phosphate transaminase [Elusimicrobiota bacterium]
MQAENLIRPEVKNFQPYLPGKPISEAAREFGLKKIIKLASNENPLGPSPLAVKKIKRTAGQLYFYPESSGVKLREALGKKLNISPNRIILGNGSDEIIELLGKTFLNKEDEIIVSEHSFIRYAMAGRLMGCAVKSIPMENFNYDISAIDRAITPKTKIIFVANPNNPTGTYIPKDGLIKLLRITPKNVLFVCDEAYYEYASLEKNYPQTLEYLKDHENLIILRTFSKIYALAGLRIGYGIASAKIIDYLDRMRPPFNVNTLAQVAAEASLGDRKQIIQAQRLVKEGKEYLYNQLLKMEIDYIPSAANFVLINLAAPGKKMFQDLLKEGVIVRAMDEYNLPYSIRVTIGKKSEMLLFIKALKKVLGK